MTYEEKLQDPRWQKKRLEVLERDNWKCVSCGDKGETLNVHHKFYKKDLEPWQYKNPCLVTLCETCHKLEHKIKPAMIKMIVASILSKGFLFSDFPEIAEKIGEKNR